MDPKTLLCVVRLSNDELLAHVKHLAERERGVTASLIAHLAELDERRLYLAEGYSSLFAYCTQVLHLSEHATYGRIEAARLIRRFPLLLDMLEDGSVNLTTVGLLGPHLTDENHQTVLDLARHKSKRQVEELLARLHPQPPVPSSIRKLPTVSHTTTPPPIQEDLATSRPPTGDSEDIASQDLPIPTFVPSRGRPATIIPLAPERYKVQFTASAETYKKFRLAQDLLRHQIPDGDPAVIFDRALTVLLKDLVKKKLAATDRPRESSNRVPEPPGLREVNA